MTQVTISTPDGEAAPLDVAFVIDISGSMATEVSSGESDGFSWTCHRRSSQFSSSSEPSSVRTIAGAVKSS